MRKYVTFLIVALFSSTCLGADGDLSVSTYSKVLQDLGPFGILSLGIVYTLKSKDQQIKSLNDQLLAQAKSMMDMQKEHKEELVDIYKAHEISLIDSRNNSREVLHEERNKNFEIMKNLIPQK